MSTKTNRHGVVVRFTPVSTGRPDLRIHDEDHMSDNRARPRIHRCDDKHDALIRAYARSRGIEPWQALEIAIDVALSGGLERASKACDEHIAELANARKVAADLRAELAAAREATRRADAEVERLTRELATARASTPQPCAAALPGELDQRVRACIAARPNAVPPRDFAFVVKNGCDRIEGSDRYQDKIKAENAARRAERGA